MGEFDENSLYGPVSATVAEAADTVAQEVSQDPAANQQEHRYDRAALAARVQDLQGKLKEVVSEAQRRGEPAPSIQGEKALSVDATSLQNPQDVVQLAQELDGVERDVAGEAGKQLQQQAGDALSGLSGFAMANNDGLPGLSSPTDKFFTARGAVQNSSIMASLQGLLKEEGLALRNSGVTHDRTYTSPADYNGPEHGLAAAAAKQQPDPAELEDKSALRRIMA